MHSVDGRRSGSDAMHLGAIRGCSGCCLNPFSEAKAAIFVELLRSVSQHVAFEEFEKCKEFKSASKSR